MRSGRCWPAAGEIREIPGSWIRRNSAESAANRLNSSEFSHHGMAGNLAVLACISLSTGKTGKVFFVLEHSRVNNLRGIVGGREVVQVTDKRQNNKFLLVSVDFGPAA